MKHLILLTLLLGTALGNHFKLFKRDQVNPENIEEELKLIREEIIEMKFYMYELGERIIIHNGEIIELREKINKETEIISKISDIVDKIEDKKSNQSIGEDIHDPFNSVFSPSNNFSNDYDNLKREVNILKSNSIKYVEKLDLLSFFEIFYQNDPHHYGDLSYLWASYYTFLRFQDPYHNQYQI